MRIVLPNWNQLSDWFMAQIHDIWDIKREEEKLSMYTEAKSKSAQQVGHFEVVFPFVFSGIKSAH